MNSKVKDLCKKCEDTICENYKGCAFRSLTNEYCDEVENLDKYIKNLEQSLTEIREYIDNQSYKDLIPVELNIIKKMVDKALGESNE